MRTHARTLVALYRWVCPIKVDVVLQGFAPVDIQMNGHMLAEHHDVADWDWKLEQWEVPVAWLRTRTSDHDNTLAITLCHVRPLLLTSQSVVCFFIPPVCAGIWKGRILCRMLNARAYVHVSHLTTGQ